MKRTTMDDKQMSKDEEVNGARIAAQILNAMDPARKERIVSSIKEKVPNLAVKIEENLWRFEDIEDLPSKGLQLLVQSVNHHDLILSMKATTPAVRDAILRNVSERKAALVNDDFANLPPVKLEEVQAAQKRILIILEELRSQGKIQSPEREKDLYV